MPFLIRPFRGPGPVHLLNEFTPGSLAWCGMRTQFRHVTRPGNADEVTCPRCLVAIRENRPRAWRRS